jgi:diadenosine tetraphosphate (Ap4A) HIT family hydrolase
MDDDLCPFCHIELHCVPLQNELGMVFLDAFPVAVGHALVVPKRHVCSVFDLDTEEQIAIWKLVAEAREMLVRELHPDGFTIGINDGAAAGQTVMHGHVHVIPRLKGDVADPRGGIRWIIPAKAAYWTGGVLGTF